MYGRMSTTAAILLCVYAFDNTQDTRYYTLL